MFSKIQNTGYYYLKQLTVINGAEINLEMLSSVLKMTDREFTLRVEDESARYQEFCEMILILKRVLTDDLIRVLKALDLKSIQQDKEGLVRSFKDDLPRLKKFAQNWAFLKGSYDSSMLNAIMNTRLKQVKNLSVKEKINLYNDAVLYLNLVRTFPAPFNQLIDSYAGKDFTLVRAFLEREKLLELEENAQMPNEEQYSIAREAEE